MCSKILVTSDQESFEGLEETESVKHTLEKFNLLNFWYNTGIFAREHPICSSLASAPALSQLIHRIQSLLVKLQANALLPNIAAVVLCGSQVSGCLGVIHHWKIHMTGYQKMWAKMSFCWNLYARTCPQTDHSSHFLMKQRIRYSFFGLNLSWNISGIEASEIARTGGRDGFRATALS